MQQAFAITADEEEEQVLDYDDPLAILIREHKAEKQKREEHEVLAERHVQQRHASEQEKQDDEDRLHAWHASAAYRHAIKVLSSDVDDVKRATTWARERADLEQRQAREALEQARRDALVVDGNRRVYFTRDGSRLYGEDDRQITNEGTIAEAQRQRLAKPEATSYEDYTARKNANQLATDRAEKLTETASKLDELDKRIKKGDLSPEELAQARSDQQTLVEGLPASARAEYERLQTARKDESKLSYRAADPTFTSAPELNTDFRQAIAATKEAAAQGQESQPRIDRQTPAYKSAPDY